MFKSEKTYFQAFYINTMERWVNLVLDYVIFESSFFPYVHLLGKYVGLCFLFIYRTFSKSSENIGDELEGNDARL